MKKFSVVEFPDHSVDLVPRNWLNIKENTSKWPKEELNKDYYKCVQRMLPINNAWKSYKIQRIMTSSDDLERARELMVEAYDHSDFTSDAEKQKQNRRERARKNLSSELEDTQNVSASHESGRKKMSEKGNLLLIPVWNKPKIAGGSSNPTAAKSSQPSTSEPSGSKDERRVILVKDSKVLKKKSKQKKSFHLKETGNKRDKEGSSRSPSPAIVHILETFVDLLPM